MFNINDYRVRDLDELIYHDYKKGEPYNPRSEKHSYFTFSKTCYGSFYYNKETDELEVIFKNNVIDKTSIKFGANYPLKIEDVDLNAMFENLTVLDHHSSKKIITNKGEFLATASRLMKNIEKCGNGEKLEVSAKDIVGKEVYEKAMKKAMKAYSKDQEETIDSQTPDPFP